MMKTLEHITHCNFTCQYPQDWVPNLKGTNCSKHTEKYNNEMTKAHEVKAKEKHKNWWRHLKKFWKDHTYSSIPARDLKCAKKTTEFCNILNKIKY